MYAKARPCVGKPLKLEAFEITFEVSRDQESSVGQRIGKRSREPGLKRVELADRLKVNEIEPSDT